ncbi:MAG: hypothetical protein HY074_06460 [Deltaproteobacteria bacterium]|nr:hypothetical protein [Deltaproteobacteria bacterium]
MIALGILGMVIALLLCEGWLRWQVEKAGPDDWETFMLPVYTRVHKRIFQVWTQNEKTSYLNPPYSAFANIGFDDPARVTAIYPFARLAPSQTLTGHDFLRDPVWAQAHPYTATINSLGYRDPERVVKKKAGTIRILCLGEYQTFGHAVNDQQTFTYLLEKFLNAKNLGYHFEVWNAGIHASTAVMGYARLQREGLNYQPDLVFLEYGLVDVGSLYDFYAPEDHVLRGVPKPILLRSFSKDMQTQLIHRLYTGLFSPLYVGYVMATRILGIHSEEFLKRSVMHFEEIMAKMIATLKQKNIPVVLLDQVGADFRRPYYKAIAQQNHVELWTIDDAFKTYPPSKKDFEEFDRTPDNFVEEFGRFKNRVAVKPWYPRYRPYLSSFYQLSAKGYEALAHAVSDKVAEKIRRGGLLEAAQ